MNPQQIVIALFSAIEAQKFEHVLAYLADDFQFSTGDAMPLDQEEWLALQRALAAAIPDLTNNYVPRGASYGVVRGSIQLIGTQTGCFDLPIAGMPALPPTGAHISLPREKVDVVVVKERVMAIRLESLPDGGLAGIVAQLRAELAAM